MKGRFAGAIVCVSLLLACNENPTPKLDTKSAVDAQSSPMDSINTLIKGDPNNAELYFDRARMHYANRDMASSLSDIGRTLGLDSSYVPAYLLMADLKLISNQSREARDVLHQALERNPKDVDVLVKLGELHMVVEDYEASFEYLNAALREDVYRSEAYRFKGFNYKFLGDTTNAVSSFQTAIEQNPDDYDSYMQLGLIYSSGGFDIAMDYYKNALKVRPESLEALYAIGLFEQKSGEGRAAIKTYNTMLGIDSTYFLAYYNKGFVYLQLIHELDSAAMMFTRSINHGPKGYFAAYHNRGFAYEKLEQYEKAEADYRMALRINPQYDLSAKGMSRLESRSGQKLDPARAEARP